MQWSKLKKNAELRFADGIKERVELRSTRYRYGHELVGRGILVIDGEEAIDFCSFRYWNARNALLNETSNPLETEEDLTAYNESWDRSEKQVRERGVLSQDHFYAALRSYLDSSIEQCLASDDLIVRGLSFIDRRLGKRRLRKLIEEPLDHEIHRRLLELRCSVEGIPVEGTPTAAPLMPPEINGAAKQ